MQALAVVPIFVNAGAAVLPIVLGFIASHGAVLLRPREWGHVIRRNPARSALWLGSVSLLIAAFSWGVSAAGLPPVNPDAHDWAQVAREIMNQSHDRAPTTVVEGEAPVNLRRVWRFNREGAMFLSTPAVDERRVFVAGSRYEGADFVGFLTCLDIQTGKPIWQITQMDGRSLPPFASSPVLTPDGRSVLIGQGLHADHECGLCCFDAASGELRWIVRSTSHVESTPAIHGDFSAVGVGAIEGPDGKPTGDPGHVMAVRISDGQLLWRQPLNDVEGSPVIDQHGIIYVGSAVNGNAVVALRPDSPDELRRKKLDRIVWRTPLGVPIASTVTLVDDLAIAGGGNSSYTTQDPAPRGLVAALNRKTGAVVWQVEFADSVLGDIAASDGIVVCPSRSGEVVALEQATGNVLWRTAIYKKTPVLSGCVIHGGHVYAISNNGMLAILDVKTGAIIEHLLINNPADAGGGMTFANPVIAGGRVFVATETGGVQCLAGTGAKGKNVEPGAERE